MPQISGIYDSYAVQPDCKIGENIGIFSLGKWSYHQVNFIEGIPAGPASTIDMVLQTGNTFIGANAALVKAIAPMLQMYDNEFMKVRFEPLDNIEVRIWELSGQAKNTARQLQSRSDRNSRWYDPYAALGTFWVLGFNRDVNIEVLNPLGYIQPTARVIIWGIRYLLNPVINIDDILDDMVKAHRLRPEQKSGYLSKMNTGDPATIKEVLGPVTMIPAEGKQA